ncbi:MAG: Gfo/Idh/MocA family oxidoreductase [Anaerolineaceae bacterium]|nr:Gfo/Idh/MocA family oxidoreductase [Anaerolineaceae bacterium]
MRRIRIVTNKVYNVGFIGVGNIAPQYIRGLALFPEAVKATACADIDMDRARAFAEANGLQAMTVEELLISPDIDIVLNLTIPAAHAEVSLTAIAAGKHVYMEKPLAINKADGAKVVAAAKEAGVRVGCAPDTFLGGGIQTAIKLIDDGAIGTPIAATAFMLGHGPEPWHPNPFFYYLPGGGPMLDMGPYYLTALVALVGPITQVAGMSGAGVKQRTAGHETIAGQNIPIEVNTHFSGSLRFANGAIGTTIMSFDTWAHHLPRIEVHGTDGSLSIPDPNRFDGEVQLWTPDKREWVDMPLTHRDDVGRGIGVADMALGIREGRPHRASGDLANHVLEVMLAFDESSEANKHIDIQSQPNRPEVLPINK